MNIPFVDLKAQYQSIKGEIQLAINQVLDETAFIKGKYVQQFEESFKRGLKEKHCVGVGNGTDAITIVLQAMGIGKGDEVITAANSFIATSEAITSSGARVVFVDCDKETYTIDVNQIKEKITRYLIMN